MADPDSVLRNTIKAHGYSLTKPRQVVFDALQNQEPQSLSSLVATCQGKIDRASVYRTIQLFEQLGIVQRLQIGWKYKLELSDSFSHHHHHLTCTQCGKVIPINEDEALEQQLHKLASTHNFLSQAHQLEIRGLCKNCQT